MIPSFKDFQTTRSTTATPSVTSVPSFKSFVQTRQPAESTRLIPEPPTVKKQDSGLFMKYFPKAAQATEKYISESVTQAKNYFEKSKHPIEFWKDYYNPKPFIEPAVESWNKARGAVDNMVQDYQKSTGSTAGDVANLATFASGVAGVLFSPITGAFAKAAEVPGLKQAADAFNVPFTVAGVAGSYASGKVVDVLPISQQSKDVLREPIKEIGSLFGQVLLGGKMMEKAGTYLKKGKEITPEVANKIVAEAKAELVKTKPELLAPKVETPATGISFKDWMEQGKPKLLERPKEPLLLTEGVKPTEIQGEGFTMKEKATTYELNRGKAINAYQEALTKYNEKPTVTNRLKVQRLKEVRDTYLTQPKPVTPEIAPVLAGERVPTITTPESTLAQTKLAEVKPTVAPEITTLPQPIKGMGDTFTSRVFERMKAENPEVLTGDLRASRVKLQEDAQRATSLIEKNKQEAFDIAMGKKTSNEVLSTSVNIALTEKALADGNNALAARLIKNRSLEQTRRGQELVAERGSIADNSTSRYVKELLASRLEALGKDYLADIKETVTRKSDKTKATRVIDEKVNELEKKITSRKLDTKTALDLLDKLTCV